MSLSFRDTPPTIVHCDEHLLRATYGLAELLRRPTVTLRASYGVRSVASSSRLPSPPQDEDVDMGEKKSSFLIGAELDEALARGEELEIKWPFVHVDRAEVDWAGREALLRYLLFTQLQLTVSFNTSPILIVTPPLPLLQSHSHQAEYTRIVFEELNAPGLTLLAAPLASIYALGSTTGVVVHLGSRRTTSIHVVIDSIVRWDASVQVDVGEEDCREFFLELLMQDAPLEQELRGAFLEEGDWPAGEKEKWIAQIADMIWAEYLTEDVQIPLAGEKLASGLVLGATAATEDDGGFDIAKKLVGDNAPPAPSHKTKKQQAAAVAAATSAAANAAAAAAADVVSVILTVPGPASEKGEPSAPIEKEINLGSVRHRLCEPLLLATGVRAGKETVPEAMARAVMSVEARERKAIWEGIGVVGDLARVKSLPVALTSYLTPFLLTNPELAIDTQPSHVRLLKIPEYFAEYKNATGELAPFLGASLVGKLVFFDVMGKHCITKVDYNARGPAAIFLVQPVE